MAEIIDCKTHKFPRPWDARPRYIVEYNFLTFTPNDGDNFRVCFETEPNFPQIKGTHNQPADFDRENGTCDHPAATGLWWWVSRVISYHHTEAEAVAECDKLNKELSNEIQS